MAYDPLIDRPVIGEPNPELKRPAPQQNAMLAFVAIRYGVFVLAFLYSLIGDQKKKTSPQDPKTAPSNGSWQGETPWPSPQAQCGRLFGTSVRWHFNESAD